MACSGAISACGLDGSHKLNMYRLVKTCLEKNRGKLGTAGFGSGDSIDDFCLRQD